MPFVDSSDSKGNMATQTPQEEPYLLVHPLREKTKNLYIYIYKRSSPPSCLVQAFRRMTGAKALNQPSFTT